MPGGAIRRCEVWWAPRVVSPHNPLEKKDRRILIAYPDLVAPSGVRSTLFAFGISTKPSEQQIRSGVAVPLPDKETYPSSTSGLGKPSWAIADWLIRLNPCYAEEYAGFIRQEYLDRAWELVRSIKAKPVALSCNEEAGERCQYCLIKPGASRG